MPYVYDPYNFSYVWYAEGTKPPKLSQKGQEYIPGMTDAYVEMFPNQPYSQQFPQGTKGNSTGLDPDVAPVASSSSSSASSPSNSSANQNAQRDAYEYLKRLFDGYGLGSLAPKILDYIQQGYGADTISLMLQDTQEYKARFAGNEKRRAAGLPVLSPAEYLAVERSYRQILESNGMPRGFYDSQSDFTDWIASDVSPAELQSRVEIAADAVSNSDQNYLSSLRDYGLGQGDLIAAVLDRQRALPALQKTVKEARIGAEARRNGLALSEQRAGYFADLGVSQDQARGAYQAIGEALPAAENLGRIYGESFGQTDLEDELLGGSGLASAKRKRLVTREAGAFGGSSAVGQKSLAIKSRGEF
ncbi:hypothetical protein ABZ470_23690 [Streptosporangium sp. NPDC020072]|uniref:hypothetical protein n=1 Tax=Streptosporangium sp. NPDC020072 TaxID=3154788 RepID=UPI003446D646